MGENERGRDWLGVGMVRRPRAYYKVGDAPISSHQFACPDGKSVKTLKEAEQDFVEVSPTQALLVKKEQPPIVFNRRGVHCPGERRQPAYIILEGGGVLTLQEACSTICASMMAQESKELPQPKDSTCCSPK